MHVGTNEAKTRSGSLGAQAKREPVLVKEASRIDTVILSAEQYSATVAQHEDISRAARKKTFEAGFGDWIAAQNAYFETYGIPGADLRPW